MTTIAAALRAARDRIAPASESAAGDARALLAHVLGVDAAWLLAHGGEALSDEAAAAFAPLVARAASGEPLAYLLGRRAFYDRDLIVTPAVLVPRPETETLLEQALAFAREQPAGVPLVAADVGTGSGALAVTFAAHVPAAHVYAVDLSADALDVAQRNAVLHGVSERVSFMQGDLLAPLAAAGVRLKLIMANLPYIPSALVSALDVSRHEPVLALDGGDDGLTLVRRLLADAGRVTLPGALVLLEIMDTQGAAALALVRMYGADAAVVQDFAGRDRVVWVRMSASAEQRQSG